MIKLGPCIDLVEMDPPAIILDGGASGAWTAASESEGTFTATHSAGGSCGGADEYQYAEAVLTFAACGRISVEIDGEAQRANAMPVAIVVHNTTEVLEYQGTGGGPSCQKTELAPVFGINPVEINVACGDVVKLRYYAPIGNTQAPVLECDFIVTVL
ncbi:MAG: hypothetical protein ACO1TE_29085 [Prosthecobacter sp.]